MHNSLFAFILLVLTLPSQSYASASIKSSQIDYLIETDKTLSLENVKANLQAGKFTQTTQQNLTFGVNSKPVWLHFQIENSSDQTLEYRLVSSVTWIDYLDLYFENSHNQQITIKTGDRIPGAQYIEPGVGIVFKLELTPGLNNIYLRAESNDPLVFPLSLSRPDKAANDGRAINITYGLLYGFLLALIVTNFMFYRVLGNDIYLYYSLVVLSFLMTNIGYTGQGIYWLWPDYPAFQNYIVLVLMVVYSIMILSFGIRFLNIEESRPKIYKYIKAHQFVGLIAITASVLLHNQSFSDHIAFIYLAVSTLLLLFISIINSNHVNQGKYFLAAVTLGMLGMLITDLAVMGIVPFSWLTFHLAEVGITLEASIFAFALTRQIKTREISRLKSEQQAKYDPLTNLHNRRSFYEIIPSVMNDINTNDQPLCIIMLDVDNFKLVNDTHGHNIGDQTLKIISQRVSKQLRNKDIAVRWGGEEILVLLPNTQINHAEQLAERMRKAIEENPLHVDNIKLQLSISLGVSQFKNQMSLEAFIDEADHALMHAKETGRNKVVISSAT